MIRIPLTFHSPEAIYQHLEKKVGPLRMLIKMGQALVTFLPIENNAIALRDYSLSLLQGFPLRMFEYKDGDLNPHAPPLQNQNSNQMIAEPAAPQESPPAKTLSETACMVDQAIKINDPQDFLEVTTKTHFKEVFQSMAKFQPLYNTAKTREKELMTSEGASAVKELHQFSENQLVDLKTGVMSSYKRTRNIISKFKKDKQRCQIDLDPALLPQAVESTPLNTAKLQCSLHYANKENNIEVKKLTALNQRQFVCSNYIIDKDRKSPAKGRIKVYDIQQEFQIMSTVLSEGAYGLSVIDKYLLVGNLQGSISFWNSTQGPFSNDHPFEISPKLHEGYIFDLLKNGTSPGGFGIVTLGIDFNIKIFEVSEDLITDDIVTLFFREQACFSQGREVMSIELMEQRGRLVAGSYNRLIIYDLPTKKQISEIAQRTNIYRLKRMRENLLAVANTSNISFSDPRTSPPISTCPLSQEVKALCTVNENTVCYGTSDGEIGMVDLRKPSGPFWKDHGTHHSRIYDILRMGDKLVSGDQKGLLVGWSSVEAK